MEKTPTFSRHSVYMYGTMELKFLPNEKITEEAVKKGTKSRTVCLVKRDCTGN